MTVLGGVHGDEFEGVLAARRIATLLDTDALSGTVRAVAPAHPAAWRETRRESPSDGLNLARVFPGRADGSATERLAHHLTTEAIIGADVLIDLHSGGLGFDMPLLAGYHAGEGELCERSGQLAAAFGAPFLWQHPTAAGGRSLSAAAAHGVASFYVEGRGGGQVRRDELDCYVDGVLRVLAHLGMIEGDAVSTEPVLVRGDGNTDGGITAPRAGYFVTSVGVGDSVAAGSALGQIVDDDGSTVDVVSSPLGGAIMLLRRRTRVEEGDTLAIVAAYVEGQ
ncbi:succinylglutamate desuccinylase/aspartoacylase family protein [Pseudactinotalea sp. Z1732]|uniref:succinylglutamate desuccinylase/aspartoacylase family protein n=1 Tax=Micrococcales TaxID=85006 RepID=UPI003C7C912B